MKIIVTGATGTAGAEVIRQAIADKDVTEITALVRRPLDIQHPKLKCVIHKNFADYTGLEDVFKNNDACIWALGISQTQVSKEEYHVITYDYTIAAAKAMLAANPNMAFIFLSGAGADSKEKSSSLFARVKGKTENELMRMPFKRLHMARPAGIKPIHKNPNMALANKLAVPLFPILELIAPKTVIGADVLAKAMLQLAKKGYSKPILESEELKGVVK
jgi:uncharacterized protein YbjT (DUF2867 family)